MQRLTLIFIIMSFQDVLLKITGARSVPRVFVGGKCIGGCDDTLAAQKDGRLEKMLEEAGETYF